MNIALAPGQYLIAVSGGVDSVVLLDLLRMLPDLELTVAHYDHGIRPDSAEDRRLVQALAERSKIPFIWEDGMLGSAASEATARTARYAFLERARQTVGAHAVVTAHHEDDVLETMVINLLRGSGRRGLSSLGNQEKVIRPLLQISKQQLITYAQSHNLQWHEDATNFTDDYLRNHVRHHYLATCDDDQKRQLLAINQRMAPLNKEIDELLTPLLEPSLNRLYFMALPYKVAKEVMAAWLRRHDVIDFDRKTIERLTVAGKTAETGRRIEVMKGYRLEIQPHILALV